MGDADVTARGSDVDIRTNQVTAVLDALDEDLNNLQATVQVLGQRSMHALSVQARGYSYFRRFLLGMNFIILPILLAVGLCYSTKEMIISDGMQAILHAVIMLLLYVTASLGVPLYLGTLWAIYKFSLPDDIYEDSESSLNMDDSDPLVTLSEGYESVENDFDGADAELAQNQFVHLFNNMVHPENDVNLEAKIPSAEKTSVMSLITNLFGETRDVGTGIPLASQVKAEPTSPETDISDGES